MSYKRTNHILMMNTFYVNIVESIYSSLEQKSDLQPHFRSPDFTVVCQKADVLSCCIVSFHSNE